MGEVGGFVGARGELNEGEFEGLAEEGCHDERREGSGGPRVRV